MVKVGEDSPSEEINASQTGKEVEECPKEVRKEKKKFPKKVRRKSEKFFLKKSEESPKKISEMKSEKIFSGPKKCVRIR